MIHHPEDRKLPRYDRRLTLWLVMLLHALAFALVVAGYDHLAQQSPAIFATNAARLGIPLWAGIVCAHWLLTVVLDRVVGRGRKRMARIQARIAELEQQNQPHTHAE